ncbi:MFS transporter [Deinococcus ruber]|uniref:MFS transporter n=1 Tax=Deinococcus ruber TaxID=1848197 RepID=A0A918F674_9DEIO|nr:MFS transporter [Deinococcus ruber]GGR12415.1 MFS transporter [Deinococcus ruber]
MTSVTRVTRHTDEYRRISVALFLAGFSAFSLVYCVQPLLGQFTREFHVSAAQSALSMSVSTAALALSIFLMSAVSEAFSRKRVMLVSLFGAALLNLLAAVAPGWPLLLLCRAAEGLVLGGVPAVAMAYLAEEIDPKDLGAAMGLYVGGTAFGGMTGRVCIGLLSEFTSWRVAMAVMAGLGLLAAWGFGQLLPAPRHSMQRRASGLSEHLSAWRTHLRTPGLSILFALGFLNLGVLVAVFNYLGFRLSAAPYHLSMAAISMIFVVYLLGSLASFVAGKFADLFGRVPVLLSGLGVSLGGVTFTLGQPLAVILVGMMLVTVGFFVTHSVASSSVGHLARRAKGHASALYLLAYYAGSSVVGLAGGWVWGAGNWTLLIGFCAGVLLLGVLLVLRLRAVVPRGTSTATASAP